MSVEKDSLKEMNYLFDTNKTLYHLVKDSKEGIFPASNYNFSESEEKAINEVMEIFGNKMNILQAKLK
tara:strand:+ start:130 stop:333 length:204 start_codon:yes stop_codon:yes gene_type:complete